MNYDTCEQERERESEKEREERERGGRMRRLVMYQFTVQE